MAKEIFGHSRRPDASTMLTFPFQNVCNQRALIIAFIAHSLNIQAWKDATALIKQNLSLIRVAPRRLSVDLSGDDGQLRPFFELMRNHKVRSGLSIT